MACFPVSFHAINAVGHVDAAFPREAGCERGPLPRLGRIELAPMTNADHFRALQRIRPAKGVLRFKARPTHSALSPMRLTIQRDEAGRPMLQSEPMVPGGGIEPPTRGFSVHCSTPELPGHGSAAVPPGRGAF